MKINHKTKSLFLLFIAAVFLIAPASAATPSKYAAPSQVQGHQCPTGHTHLYVNDYTPKEMDTLVVNYFAENFMVDPCVTPCFKESKDYHKMLNILEKRDHSLYSKFTKTSTKTTSICPKDHTQFKDIELSAHNPEDQFVAYIANNAEKDPCIDTSFKKSPLWNQLLKYKGYEPKIDL